MFFFKYRRRLLVNSYRKPSSDLKGRWNLEDGHTFVKSIPADVTCINDKTVTVSFPFLSQIQIINSLIKNIESVIKTANRCYGICYSVGHLFYCKTSRGIQKVNVSGNYSSTLVTDKTLSDWSYVTKSKDKIFYTKSLTDTVTCCTVT